MQRINEPDRAAAGAERGGVAADTEVGGREYDVGGTSGRVVQGVATAERLAELLAPITDAERLADIGDWLVQCDTGADFLARMGAAPAGENSDRS